LSALSRILSSRWHTTCSGTCLTTLHLWLQARVPTCMDLSQRGQTTISLARRRLRYGAFIVQLGSGRGDRVATLICYGRALSRNPGCRGHAQQSFQVVHIERCMAQPWPQTQLAVCVSCPTAPGNSAHNIVEHTGNPLLAGCARRRCQICGVTLKADEGVSPGHLPLVACTRPSLGIRNKLRLKWGWLSLGTFHKAGMPGGYPTNMTRARNHFCYVCA
jgi:hypothetical protein